MPAENNDLELIEELRTDSRDAFAQIYDRYWNKLYRAATRKVRVSENAQELVQDIFLDLWIRRQTLQVEVLEHYLTTTLRYKVINFYRKEIIRQNYIEAVSAKMVEADWNTEEEITYNDLIQAIIDCIDGMPPKTKLIFELSRVQYKSIEEIAKILNITTRTVDNHLHQAIKALRLQLKDYYICVFPVICGSLCLQQLFHGFV